MSNKLAVIHKQAFKTQRKSTSGGSVKGGSALSHFFNEGPFRKATLKTVSSNLFNGARSRIPRGANRMIRNKPLFKGETILILVRNDYLVIMLSK